MTKEEMNKYAYELMVKNNPEEAVKQLLLKDKENKRLKEELQQEKKDFKEANDYCFELKDCKLRIDKAIEYIKEQLEETKQCLEYNREQHNFFEVEKYTRDYNLYTNILKILKGEE